MSYAVTAGLVAVALAACGSGGQSDDSEASPATATVASATTATPAPAVPAARKALKARLRLVRSSSRPYAENIRSAKVEGVNVVIETDLYNDADTKGMYSAVCNVFAEAVSGAGIDRVRVFGPGGGFAACDPF